MVNVMQNIDTDIQSLGGGGFGGGFGGLGGGSGGPLMWLITLAFLRGKGGILGGEEGGEHGMGVLAGQTQSKLDCLAQNQAVIQSQINQQTQQGQFAEINSNIRNVSEVARDIAAQVASESNAQQRQMADCCCNIRREVAQVETSIAMQTNNINTVANANTQKVIDQLCANQVTALGVDNANLRQALTKAEIVAELGHKHVRGLAVQ